MDADSHVPAGNRRIPSTPLTERANVRAMALRLRSRLASPVPAAGPARLMRALTWGAWGLLVLQSVLLAVLWQRPEAPETLEPLEVPRRQRVPTEGFPAPDNQRAAVEALDRLLARRVEDAARRRGTPVPSGPAQAVRDAALARPAPDGPEVAALLAAYARVLATLGETLDATSTRGTGASPETPGPPDATR